MIIHKSENLDIIGHGISHAPAHNQIGTITFFLSVRIHHTVNSKLNIIRKREKHHINRRQGANSDNIKILQNIFILAVIMSESDIQDVMSYLDENQEANGYYYGDIGLLLLGKYKESYELMLKVE